jgi:hypothetical protein
MAEVKVKITAANQTQTGFQSVLADAQKTATQVQQTFARASTAPRMPQVKQPGGSGGPIDIDIGDYGLGPLRELQEELKRVRQSAQQAFDPGPPQQFSNGIGGVLGRFAIMIGVAATVGKVISSVFDQLSQVVKDSISIQEQFNQVLGEAGSAPTLDAAISYYKQLNSLADQTGKKINETIGEDTRSAFASFFSAKPGQLLNRGADFFGINPVTNLLRSQEQDERSKAQQALLASLERQKLDAEALSASAGDPSATERIQREQRQREQRRRLDDQLRGSASPEFIAEAKGKLEAAIAAENEAAATKDRLESEKKATQEKEKQTREAQRSAEETQREAEQKARMAEQAAKEQERIAKARKGIDQDIALTEAKLRGDKGAEEDILQQRDIDRAMEGGATFEQAANLAATNALQRQMEAANAAEGQAKMTGSFGASSLQRIGFASNEFFDTRRKEDPTKVMERMLSEQKKTNQILGAGEPLVLPASN